MVTAKRGILVVKSLININIFLAALVFFTVLFVGPHKAFAATDYYAGPFIFNVKKAEEKFLQPDSEEATASGTFSDKELDAIWNAVNYWTERIGAGKDPKLIVNLAKIMSSEGEGKGSAYSWSPSTGNPEPDVYYYLVYNDLHHPLAEFGYNTEIVFEVDYTTAPTRLLMDDNSITSTITHELMHALGMTSGIVDDGASGTWDQKNWKMSAQLSKWMSGLRDINGVQAAPGQLIFDKNDPENRSNGKFSLPKFNADPTSFAHGQVNAFPTFHGPAVDALTNGRGMPVMAGEGIDYQINGGNVLGHPALLGSIMSYLPLRNMLFTELELAALNDMGYNIDLKQFFGKSYYPTNLGGQLTPDSAVTRTEAAFLPEAAATVTNTEGFDSSASYGVGLHVYRDRLNVTQAAHINASGHGAGGVRIDGVGNTLTIPEDITVSANGPYGTGLLVSYGKENTINLHGVLEATGEQGIGAHFGIFMQSDIYSYIKKDGVDALKNSDERYYYTKMNSDLNGALVNDFNIHGDLRGSMAAIKIDNDVHVKNINVRAGANIQGNIISAWDPNLIQKADNLDYMTALNFGGSGSGAADHDFDMRYDGLISGPKGLNMYMRGGVLSFNGEADIYSGGVDAGATLKGNSVIKVDSSQEFYNRGSISPGNSIGTIVIDGNYVQDVGGNLFMEFTPSANDHFIVNGAATVAGSLTLAALPAYYSANNPLFLSNSALFDSTLSVANFSNLDLAPLSSPTLQGILAVAGDGAIFNVRRAPNAYSQYASGDTGFNVGQALSGIGDNAQGDMQNLFAALDFSRPDGGTVRSAMRQLSPAAYDNVAKASQEANRALSGMILERLRTDYSLRSTDETGRPNGAINDASNKSDSAKLEFEAKRLNSESNEKPLWSAFAMPFGGSIAQQGKDDYMGYAASNVGAAFGVNRDFTNGSGGVHAVYAHRQVDSFAASKAQSRVDAVSLGVHGLLRPAPGFFISALADIGLENTKMLRDVQIEDYARQNEAEFTVPTLLASTRLGYEWQAGDFYFGPTAGLDYNGYFRPDISESNGKATRLHLEAKDFNALRSAAGLQARVSSRLNERATLQAGVSALWMHEFLDMRDGTTATFADYGASSFSVRNRNDGHNALALQGNMALAIDENVSIAAQAGVELLRPGFSAVSGGLSIAWKF